MDENPYRPRLSLHAALGQLRDKAAQGERPLFRPPQQPFGDLARQSAFLVAADLAWRNGAGAALQRSPFGNARRADPKRLRNRTDRFTLFDPSHHAFTQIHRVGSRHPYRPRPPAGSLNQNSHDLGIPIPSKRVLL